MKMLVNYELRFKQIAINAMGWFYSAFFPDNYWWITKIITATSCIAGQFFLDRPLYRDDPN